MATDHNVQERRRYQHRGRRGPDRRGTRGTEHRTQQPQQGGDRSAPDVDQIMREIRARIAQRHGIDLSTEQIQDLAARRLEAILEPRGLDPALLDELRRGAAAQPPVPDTSPHTGPVFDEAMLYDSPNGMMRGIRRLLQPILRLFVDPAAVAGALRAQTQLTREFAAREAERDRRQTEWNALHYEILQRLATEITRVSLEMQSLSLRVESLAAKVDFNERRVRSMETTGPSPGTKPPPRAAEPPVAVGPVAVDESGAAAAAADGSAEGPRRKRRRRRGRRGSLAAGERAPMDAATGGEDDMDSESPEDIEASAANTAEPVQRPLPPEPEAPPVEPTTSVERPPVAARIEPPQLLESPTELSDASTQSVEAPAPTAPEPWVERSERTERAEESAAAPPLPEAPAAAAPPDEPAPPAPAPGSPDTEPRER